MNGLNFDIISPLGGDTNQTQIHTIAFQVYKRSIFLEINFDWRLIYFAFLMDSIFSLTFRYLRMPFKSLPGFILTIFKLNGGTSTTVTNSDKCLSMSLITVVLCIFVLSPIAVNQVPSFPASSTAFKTLISFSNNLSFIANPHARPRAILTLN